MKKLRLGVVGVGSFFLKRYLEEINSENRIKLICICRRDIKILKKIAKITKVKNIYTNYRQMLKNENLDVVLITTPHSKHFIHIRDAIKKNLNILIEKPTVVTIDEIKKLKRIIKNYKKKIISVLNPAYDPHCNKLKELISKKNFGKLEHVNIFWSDNKEQIYLKKKTKIKNFKQKNFRVTKNNKDGSIIYDVIPHLIAEMIWVSNNLPVSVYAKSERNSKIINLNISLFFRNNLTANLKIVGNSKNKKRKIESTYWSDKNRLSTIGLPYRIENFNLKSKKISRIKFKNTVKNPINEIVEYIKANKKPKIEINTSLKIVNILNCIEKSVKKKKLIDIKY